jgi:hypothetical protein
MSLIRPQASAVGAFEAQVFDMSKTYQTIMSNAAAQRKAQQESRKEAEKSMAEINAAKSGARTQDLPYLNKKYNEVTSFFSDNINNIKPGTEAYDKFNKMKADYIYETNRSKNEKEKDARFATYLSANASKEKASEFSKQAFEAQKMAIDNPERGKFKKKTADGREIGIDEIDLPELDKFSRFDEVELQKDINSLQDDSIESQKFVTNLAGFNLGAPVIQTNTVKLKRPTRILNTYTAYFNSTPDAQDTIDKEWSRLTTEQRDEINAKFLNFNKVYEAAGISDRVAVDESDKTKGISNAYEYGAFKVLEQNLPIEIKKDFDTSVANLLMSQRRFNAWMSNTKQKTQGQPVYKWISGQLKNPNYDPQSIKGVINPAITSPNQSLTQATPAFFDIDNKYQAILLTNIPIRKPTAEGKVVPVTSEDSEEAVKYAKKLPGIMGKGGKINILKSNFMQTNQQGIWKDPQSGVWFMRRITKYDLNPNLPGNESRINAVLKDAKEAQTSEESKRVIDAMMTEKTSVEQDQSSYIMNFPG